MKKNKASNNPEQETAVISFVGDMKENIQNLLYSLQCRCGADHHFQTILGVYSEKINKLRMQRDHYKLLYEETLQKLSSSKKPSYCLDLSLASTRQGQRQIKQQQNVYEHLRKQLYEQASFNLSYQQKYEDSPRQNLKCQENSRQQSLLISQQSRESSQIRNENTVNRSEKKLGKSFEEFVRDQVQSNYMKMKISQDIKTLGFRKMKQNSPRRVPLSNKLPTFFN